MPGSARLRENDILKKMTVEQAEQERLVGAICAAPAVVLQEWGLLEERKVCLKTSVNFISEDGFWL
jgi:4-methyl-5(b-hydroxyethyl)-thiazole monophosphate biosynthesis